MSRQNLPQMVRREWPRLFTASRGTIAALVALAFAVKLQLECPYWAAMTALIVIQPTRGLLMEKSYYRLIGTAIGATAGLTLLLTATSPAMLTILLAIWLAGCVAIGNVLYGFRSYASLLAGYTCAVIAMIGYQNQPHIHALAFARVACIIIGIVVATTITLFFTRSSSNHELPDCLRQVVIASVEWLTMLARGAAEKKLIALRQDILMDIVAIEGALDVFLAGSLSLKRRKRHIRSLIVSLLSLLEAGKLAGDHLARQNSGDGFWRESLASQLEEVSRRLEVHGTPEQVAPGLPAIPAAAGAHFRFLVDTLGEVLTSLQLVSAELGETAAANERIVSTGFIRHRDWLEAGRAALRAAVAIAAAGLLWHFTGWGAGPLMLMATAIMVSLFSTHDHPALTLATICCGAALGVSAAFFSRLVLLPGASTLLQQGFVCIPVLLTGIIALSHRRTAMGAMDAMLFFLFVMQPGVAAVAPPAIFVAGGFACFGGIAVAMLAFRFLLPIDPARRLRSLLIAISKDLTALAAVASRDNAEKIRARLHHRVLRLLATAGKLDNDLTAIIEGGLAALAICRYLQQSRKGALQGDATAAAIRETVRTLAAASRNPEEILSLLPVTACRLGVAMAAPPVACMESVRQSLPAVPDTQQSPSLLTFVGREDIQCPI